MDDEHRRRAIETEREQRQSVNGASRYSSTTPTSAAAAIDSLSLSLSANYLLAFRAGIRSKTAYSNTLFENVRIGYPNRPALQLRCRYPAVIVDRGIRRNGCKNTSASF